MMQNTDHVFRNLYPWLAFVLALSLGLSESKLHANEFVRLDFNLSLQSQSQNAVFIELFDDRPLTRDNFLQYIDAELYDGTIMHRLVPGFVMQGGGFYETLQPEPAPINISLAQDRVDLDGNPATGNPTVDNEFTNLPFRSNLRATLSMAKTAAGPDSATNQFFFNLENNAANLDNQNGGFTVFAEVVGNGMNLVDGLAGLGRTNLNPDILVEDAFGNPLGPGSDGNRDFGSAAGPFTDVPFLGNSLVRVENAERIAYFKDGTTSNVPAAGLAFSGLNAFIDTGATFTGTGNFVVDTGTTLGINHNITLAQGVENHGTFAPGQQLGAVTLSTFEQTSTGVFDVQLRDAMAGTDYDQLNLTGMADLDGTLRVEFLGGFVPSAEDAFTILTASGGISGQFTSFDLPTLPSDLFWELRSTTTSISLVVVPDFNADDLVDGNDLTIWQSEFGGVGTMADADNDGDVDGIDFLAWQRNHGATALVATSAAVLSAVPEPTSLALFLFAIAHSVMTRRR